MAALGLTPVFLLVGFLSAGGGHGDYVLARILFPFAVLLMIVGRGSLYVLVILATIAQYPAYGLILSWAARRSRFSWAALAVGTAHAAAAALTFLFSV
jgi:hypothetical protein